MKILVGIDLEGTYRAPMELCARLQFADPSWILAHAVPVAPSYSPGFSPMSIPVVDTMLALRETGQRALDRAIEELGVPGAAQILLEGNAAASLMRAADEEGVDLIAMGAGQPRHGLLWTIGSVSRAVSLGAPQSLLVGKSPDAGHGPIHAVFATDHSEYANGVVDRLIEWAPAGLGQIDVFTAYDPDDYTHVLLDQAAAETDSPSYREWALAHARQSCEEVAAKLRAICPNTKALVELGHPNEAIRKVMESSGADLLILGAHGHGFIERLVVGSVSLHQMVAEPYPVLLIRMK